MNGNYTADRLGRRCPLCHARTSDRAPCFSGALACG
jgi:hypothetical protein